MDWHRPALLKYIINLIKMRKIVLSTLLLLTYLNAAGQFWHDPVINSQGRLPARATSYPYASESDARTCNRDISDIKSLNGEWMFRFADDVAQEPEGFNAEDYEASEWERITVTP